MANVGKLLQVIVITPARKVYDDSAAALVVPAFDGELGVLPGHADLMSLLGPGELRITQPDGRKKSLAVRGGFLQVSGPNVTVLTPESYPAEDLNRDALDAELGKLLEEKVTRPDLREALEQKLRWVKARKKTAERKY